MHTLSLAASINDTCNQHEQCMRHLCCCYSQWSLRHLVLCLGPYWVRSVENRQTADWWAARDIRLVFETFLDGSNPSSMLMSAVVMHVREDQICFRMAEAVSLAFGDYYLHDPEGFATLHDCSWYKKLDQRFCGSLAGVWAIIVK